jgi:hypothetical protein
MCLDGKSKLQPHSGPGKSPASDKYRLDAELCRLGYGFGTATLSPDGDEAKLDTISVHTDV